MVKKTAKNVKKTVSKKVDQKTETLKVKHYKYLGVYIFVVGCLALVAIFCLSLLAR